MKLAIPVNPTDHIQGLPNAPVVLVQYGDFQCPYCGRAYPVIKEIQKKYGDKLAFVFRQFPLVQLHEYAAIAAEASEAASTQGKFWPYHDGLYENQQLLSPQLLQELAVKLGLDVAKFDADMLSGSEKPVVVKQVEGGVASGVHQTPTFFINGEMFTGTWEDPVQFLGAIDLALQNAEKKA